MSDHVVPKIRFELLQGQKFQSSPQTPDYPPLEPSLEEVPFDEEQYPNLDMDTNPVPASLRTLTLRALIPFRSQYGHEQLIVEVSLGPDDARTNA